ncbi:unnamed protein product [Schistocephalus solidus]|uniref:Uncharacterized protein n=1 Tax=Schistocephalus solidus TaxID=70667 RepID=A0A3P7EY20_SCHSO|nr:unnamed protein product [Schistocephalus solidus]
MPVLLPLVEMHNGRVFEILKNLSLAPHLLEECCNTSVATLCLWPATPEEGVAGTHLLQLTLLRESGLVESSNFHLVASSQLTSAVLRSDVDSSEKLVEITFTANRRDKVVDVYNCNLGGEAESSTVIHWLDA